MALRCEKACDRDKKAKVRNVSDQAPYGSTSCPTRVGPKAARFGLAYVSTFHRFTVSFGGRQRRRKAECVRNERIASMVGFLK